MVGKNKLNIKDERDNVNNFEYFVTKSSSDIYNTISPNEEIFQINYETVNGFQTLRVNLC